MVDATPLLLALDRAGYRRTVPRSALVRLIADQSGHFSAADLEADARAIHLGVGRATVFRTLEALAEAGAVERIDLPSGEHAYVACEPTHHHHVVCTRCGATHEIDDVGLRAIVRAAERSGFRIERHRLELFGLCQACQASGTS
jgi:Fur family ferric uptake transcriptional regulator